MGKAVIGVIVPEVNGYHLTTALRGMEEALTAHGYGMLITQSHGSSRQEASVAQLLMKEGVLGIIASPAGTAEDLQHFSAYTKHGIPVVFFNHLKRLEQTISVAIDNHCCGWMVADHLAGQGCRRFAMYTTDAVQGVNALRYSGFRRGLRDAGIHFSDGLLMIGDMEEKGGVDLAVRLLAMDAMPDAVFVTGDLAAVTCMDTLSQAGVRIPEDLAVVGFNNEPASRLVRPSLSTIDCSGTEVGRIAAEKLLGRLTGTPAPAEPQQVIVPARLIVRHSSERSRTGDKYGKKKNV